MKKLNGLHLYIYISNFNDTLEDEERKAREPRHSIHALDTYFTSIEEYARRTCEECTIEKITGARLHIYIEGSTSQAYGHAENISSYARKLSTYLLDTVGKYNSLVRFKIKIGMDYGKFHVFEFKDKSFSELTSIGYAANYAAKLQCLSSESYLSISDSIYDELSEEQQKYFIKKYDQSIKKYNKSYFYTKPLTTLKKADYLDHYLDRAVTIANRTNLIDMRFRDATTKANFDNLSKKECKKLKGIPLFADVRGFTAKFNDDDSNLDEMSIKTHNILKSMYDIVQKHNGIHIQFQGDREFALFHNYSDYNCYADAIISGLQIIDKVQQFQVCVGVGQDVGNLFASKIGARSEKDYILLGRTVNNADINEDQYAKENELVISKTIYDSIHLSNPILAKQFTKRDEIYYTRKGYEYYTEQVYYSNLMKNNHSNSYNGAWHA